MNADELRERTKHAVWKWSTIPPNEFWLITPLDELRTGHREALRQRNNQAFRKKQGFPIDGDAWSKATLKTVGDLRDLNKRRLEG